MKPEDIEMFEAIAGECLTTLGYERTFDVISPKIAHRAEQCERRWEQERDDPPKTAEARLRLSGTATSNVASQAPSENPYVFIVGCPRSGTTLLKRMVSAHPQIAITRETHWITRFYKGRVGLTADGLVTPELIPKLFEYHRFAHLKIDRAEVQQLIESNDPMTYAEFVSRLFDHYGHRKGKRFVGDKTPGYVRNIPLLHELWPNARFVHLIRDARDVCLSMAKWRMTPRAAGRFSTWSEDPVSTAALWWKWHVQLGIEGGRVLGSDLYYELQYESLVKNPARECERLCTFLDLPYDDVMIKFYQGRTKKDAELSANRAWLPATPGLRNWRSQMPPDEVERVEAVVGDILDILDYPRAFAQPDRNVMEHAVKLSERFNQDASLE